MNIGGKTVQAAYLGSSEVSAARLGSSLLWRRASAPPLALIRKSAGYTGGMQLQLDTADWVTGGGRFSQTRVLALYEKMNAASGGRIDIQCESAEVKSFTLEFWFRATGFHPYYRSSGEYAWDSRFGGRLNVVVETVAYSAALFRVIIDSQPIAVNGAGNAITQISPFDDTWHHCVVTYDGACRVFFDGQAKIALTSVATISSFFSQSWRIRLDLSHTDASLYTSDPVMLLDEIALFDYVRYAGNFTPPTEPYSLTQ